jgi:hypothetical protein
MICNPAQAVILARIRQGPADKFKKFPVPKTFAVQNETVCEGN